MDSVKGALDARVMSEARKNACTWEELNGMQL